MRKLSQLPTYVIRNHKKKYFKGTETRRAKVSKGTTTILVKSRSHGIRKACYR
jgi:hypothetical protein